VSRRKRRGAARDGSTTAPGSPTKISNRQASDPLRNRSREMPVASAVAYPPCRGRGQYVVITICPECLAHHQHRARDLPHGGILRRMPCDGGQYRIVARIVVVQLRGGAA
jgi:hypothetical protein